MTKPAFIFDLDGVVVNTAFYHYLAWKQLANSLGFEFTEKDNELLKGVSRIKSLEIVLNKGGIKAIPEDKEKWAKQKNDAYISMIKKITPADILPGAREILIELKANNYKTAIGSASKNTMTILAKLDLVNYFDVVIDGNMVHEAKPNPEVFLRAAKELQTEPKYCIVFEDAIAGVTAAKAANMFVIGVGEKEVLSEANYVVKSLKELNLKKVLEIIC